MDYRTLLSRHRTAIMGLAAVLVIFSHGKLSNLPFPVGTLVRHGQLGVDIFIFLSGFGVAFSLEKGEPLSRFYGRRLSRILPPYYAHLLLLAVLSLLERKTVLETMQELFIKLLPIGIWLNNWITRWYISAILGYYVIAALIYPLLRASRRLWVTTVLLVLVVAGYVPLISRMDNVNVAIMRLPGLVLGLAAGASAQPGREKGSTSQWPILACIALCFALGTALYAFRDSHALRSMAILSGDKLVRLTQGLVGAMLAVLAALLFEGFSRLRLGVINRFSQALGRVSLELYLGNSVLNAFFNFHFSPAVALVGALALAYPAAVLIRWTGDWLLRHWGPLVRTLVGVRESPTLPLKSDG